MALNENRESISPEFYPSLYGSSCEFILSRFLSIMMFPKQEGDCQETDRGKKQKENAQTKKILNF